MRYGSPCHGRGSRRFDCGHAVSQRSLAALDCCRWTRSLQVMVTCPATLGLRDLRIAVLRSTCSTATKRRVRVDLYSNGERLFVGEITNTHADASQSFMPPSAEFVASDLIFH